MFLDAMAVEMSPKVIAWALVAMTILLTTYGQLVLKWQVGVPSATPHSALRSWPPVLLLLLRPWVISAFIAAFGASLCWMAALRHLELSRAYPFMALNFLLVVFLAAPLFGEALTAGKIIGLLLVLIGLAFVTNG